VCLPNGWGQFFTAVVSGRVDLDYSDGSQISQMARESVSQWPNELGL